MTNYEKIKQRKMNRENCPMRHKENGNCLVAGGFCTAVNEEICESLHNAFYWGSVIASKDCEKVTRCKDCWAYETAEYDGGEKRVCRLYKRQMQENDFCSYGEINGDESE